MSEERCEHCACLPARVSTFMEKELPQTCCKCGKTVYVPFQRPELTQGPVQEYRFEWLEKK